MCFMEAISSSSSSRRQGRPDESMGRRSDSSPSSMLAVLYQDIHESRHLKTYLIDIRDKELKEGHWHSMLVDSDARFLIPVPSPQGKCL